MRFVMKDLYDLETLYVDTTKKILHSLSQGEKDGIEGICPFVAQVGKNYENSLYRLMFIGKATNGWISYLDCNATDDEIDSLYKMNILIQVLKKGLFIEMMKCSGWRISGQLTVIVDHFFV